jgi:predicted aldo/keto reductase-like oxidoreductase
VDASYLYAELEKRHIPAVIMEPLLGGRLVKDLPQYAINELKQRDPQKSIASWAFRYAGTPEGVLTVLSGMTFMEHLKDNLLSYCPLEPLTEEEQRFLDTEIAQQMMEMGTIPCNNCQYCMPCPYGIDIPGIFVHYNKWLVEKTLPKDKGDENYRKNRRNYLISLDRAIPKDRQPDHCIMCNHCIEVKTCPQKIRIPQELKKIADLMEQLKRDE